MGRPTGAQIPAAPPRPLNFFQSSRSPFLAPFLRPDLLPASCPGKRQWMCMECCGYREHIFTRRLRHPATAVRWPEIGRIRRHFVGGPLPIRCGSVGRPPVLERISLNRPTGDEFLETLTLPSPQIGRPAPEAFR
jgi:hypothetical protein